MVIVVVGAWTVPVGVKSHNGIFISMEGMMASVSMLLKAMMSSFETEKRSAMLSSVSFVSTR